MGGELLRKLSAVANPLPFQGRGRGGVFIINGGVFVIRRAQERQLFLLNGHHAKSIVCLQFLVLPHHATYFLNRSRYCLAFSRLFSLICLTLSLESPSSKAIES